MSAARATTLARVARSVVGIRAGRSLGCAFVALPNGMLVTSQALIGFEREVLVLLDDERVVTARVLRVNVALDVALVLPDEPLGLEALGSVQQPPAAGDEVTVVGKTFGQTLALPTAVVGADVLVEGHAHLLLAANLDSMLQGAPVIDADGRVRGVVTRRRRRYGHVVLPTYAYEGGLESVHDTPAALAGLVPEYGCPECDTIFEPDHARCLECGRVLPHADRPAAPPAAPPPAVLGGVRVLLRALGAAAGARRLDARTWSLIFVPTDGEACELRVVVDVSGRNISLQAPLVHVVSEAHEPFYRFLLTLNDDTLGVFQASVHDGCAFLSSSASVSFAATHAASLASELVAAARHYRGVLERAFGAEPAHESEET